MFSCEFGDILKNIFYYRTLPGDCFYDSNLKNSWSDKNRGYSKPWQTSKMERYQKIITVFNYFRKTLLIVWKGSSYASKKGPRTERYIHVRLIVQNVGNETLFPWKYLFYEVITKIIINKHSYTLKLRTNSGTKLVNFIEFRNHKRRLPKKTKKTNKQKNQSVLSF